MEFRVGICLFILQLCACGLAYADVDYIDSYCGQTITVWEAVRIKLRSYSWPIGTSCSVTLRSDSIYHMTSSTRLLVKFLKLNLPSSTLGTCRKARVDILDSDGTILSDSSGTCGSSLPFWQPWKSSGNKVTIRFKNNNALSRSGSFEILATQFTTGICAYGEFDCYNGRCVDDDLTCDGYDNCGDDSDELNGCYWAPGKTAGVAVASIVSFMFFVFLFGAVYRRRTYGRIFWSTTVPYRRTQPVAGAAVVASAQYGVQNPAPVYSTPGGPAPPPPYPGSPYQAAGPKY